MKKLLSFVLAIVVIFSLAVSVNAAPSVPAPPPAEGAVVVSDFLNAGFHCNADHGNGKVEVAAYETLMAAAKAAKTKYVPVNLQALEDKSWLLLDERFECPKCHSTVWVSYSNKSGVPDGKNIQLTHPAKKDPPPVEPDAALSLLKTVGGVPFVEWAAAKGLTSAQIDEIIAGMKFTAYLLNGEGGSRAGMSYPGTLSPLSGVVDFGDVISGWYEIVEEISGTAVNHFVGTGKTQVLYVGKTGVNSEIVNIISGQEGVGTIVEHNGTDVDYVLPNVWNDRLAGQPAFNELMAMGARWVWDQKDTYLYGMKGSAIEIPFKVTLAEPITAKLHFAADNVAIIYVNGKVAAMTEMALSGRGVNIGDAYVPNVLGTLNADMFDGRWSEGWAHTYTQEIALKAGENDIVIVAGNSSSTGHYDENNSFVQGTTGTDNDKYNLRNNPCGLIFGFEIPATTFDNEPIASESGMAVVPMVSIPEGTGAGAKYDASRSWGFQHWGGIHNFQTPNAWDTDGFVTDGFLTPAYFIWDKTQEDVNAGEDNVSGGFDTAYIKYVYDTQDKDDTKAMVFTNFRIAADNEFALLVNGKVVAASAYVNSIHSGLMGKTTEEIMAIWAALNPADYWSLNTGEPSYDWTHVYTVPAADMLAAVGTDDIVTIEIFALNAPEECYPHSVDNNWGNPCMVTFAGTFKYDTVK